MYCVRMSRQSLKDKKLLKQAGLEGKARKLLEVIRTDPWQTPPPYEKLTGDLQGLYSRRINIHHRLVYSADHEEATVEGTVYEGTVVVYRMWSHYE